MCGGGGCGGSSSGWVSPHRAPAASALRECQPSARSSSGPFFSSVILTLPRNVGSPDSLPRSLSADQLFGARRVDHRLERLARVMLRAPPELTPCLARVHDDRR